MRSYQVNLTLEAVFGLDTAPAQFVTPAPEGHKTLAANGPCSSRLSTNHSFKRGLLIVERVAVVLAVVAVSILVPDFSSMMAILGSFSAFLICVIGPMAAKLTLDGHSAKDVSFIVVAIAMGAWGSYVAFMAADPS